MFKERSVTFTYRNNHGTDYHWGSIEEQTIDALEFIDRFLLHVMPARMTRVRKFGWWSGTKKAKELPRIRKALGMPEVQVESREEPSKTDKFDGDTGVESEEKIIRVICRAVQPAFDGAGAYYPKPSIGRIMKWSIWPELEPGGDQMVLPAVEPYLPDGSLYLQAIGFT